MIEPREKNRWITAGCGPVPGPAPSKYPARSLPPVHKNNPVKSFKFLRRDKAYIPVSREQEYVANHKMKNNCKRK